MKNFFRTITAITLLTGALWQISAQAAPQSLDAYSDDGYALKVKKTDPNAITLAANTTANKNDDQSLGLKIGSKSSIQLYGTIDIGYSKWSQKN